MKTSTTKFSCCTRRVRFLSAVAVGLGLGWALSASLGVAVGFAVGGSVTVAMLAGRKQ